MAALGQVGGQLASWRQSPGARRPAQDDDGRARAGGGDDLGRQRVVGPAHGGSGATGGGATSVS